MRDFYDSRIEQLAWGIGLNRGSGDADLRRHHFSVVSSAHEKHFFPIASPSWIISAIGGNLPSARAGWKRPDINFAPAGLIGDVRDPLSIGRNLRLVFSKLCL